MYLGKEMSFNYTELTDLHIALLSTIKSYDGAISPCLQAIADRLVLLDSRLQFALDNLQMIDNSEG